METQVYKYDQEQTENHIITRKYRDIIVDIDDILKNEHCLSKKIFSGQTVLNIDKFKEKTAQGRENIKSVDFAFVVYRNNSNKTVLIEAKCDVKTVKNLSKNEISEKIKHSKQIIGNDTQYYETTFVLLKKSVEVAKRYLKRLFANSNVVSGMTVTELKQKFFDTIN